MSACDDDGVEILFELLQGSLGRRNVQYLACRAKGHRHGHRGDGRACRKIAAEPAERREHYFNDPDNDCGNHSERTQSIEKQLKVVANVRNKFNTAYFGWVKFTMETEAILELKKKLDFDPNFIRFLILKTVKENTIAAKRFVRGDALHKRFKAKTGEAENAAPINKEEIDKEIDALIAA